MNNNVAFYDVYKICFPFAMVWMKMRWKDESGEIHERHFYQRRKPMKKLVRLKFSGLKPISFRALRRFHKTSLILRVFVFMKEIYLLSHFSFLPSRYSSNLLFILSYEQCGIYDAFGCRNLRWGKIKFNDFLAHLMHPWFKCVGLEVYIDEMSKAVTSEIQRNLWILFC